LRRASQYVESFIVTNRGAVGSVNRNRCAVSLVHENDAYSCIYGLSSPVRYTKSSIVDHMVDAEGGVVWSMMRTLFESWDSGLAWLAQGFRLRLTDLVLHVVHQMRAPQSHFP
jgi:hypothetical protein